MKGKAKNAAPRAAALPGLRGMLCFFVIGCFMVFIVLPIGNVRLYGCTGSDEVLQELYDVTDRGQPPDAVI